MNEHPPVDEGGEVIDPEAIAAHDFTAWDRDNCPLPTNKQWIADVNPSLVALRLAFSINCMSKPELIEAIKSMEREQFNELFGPIADCKILMEGYFDVAATACTRMICCMAAAGLASEA